MNSNDSIKKISLEEAKKEIAHLKYALVYQYSKVIFERIENVENIAWDECVEAYFFDEKKQIHLYQYDNELQGICFEEKETADYIDKEYVLTEQYRTVGTTLKKREYLDYDADGQVFVKYTRLVDVE